MVEYTNSTNSESANCSGGLVGVSLCRQPRSAGSRTIAPRKLRLMLGRPSRLDDSRLDKLQRCHVVPELCGLSQVLIHVRTVTLANEQVVVD
jgi:hypothetical protein